MTVRATIMAITTDSTHHHYAPSSSLPISSRLPQDRLEEYVSKGAAHNSLERGIDAPKCHPETRKAVQANILSHVACGKEKVLWLSGPAGSGKTAIMGSIAYTCYTRRWLAGSFFISKSAMRVDRHSKRFIVPTLAFHLLELIPGLRELILASIERNPSVFDKQLEHQVEILILRPIRELCKTADASEWPRAMLVDGVDECTADEGREYETEYERQESKEANHREVLSALVKLASNPTFSFRIVIASRPENAIEEYFSSLRKGAVARIFLDEKYGPEDDIALYGEAMLTKIGRECGFLRPWYSQVGEALGIEDVPRHLAQQSLGQFIYIATAIRYVQTKSKAPHKLLEQVLNWRSNSDCNAFASLDALYTGILESSPDSALSVKWLRSIPLFRQGDPWLIKFILESSPGQTQYLLGPLVSLVCIVDRRGNPIFHFYHKSLSDFLEDPKRCGTFHITDDDLEGFLAHRHIEILKNKGLQSQVPRKGALDGVLEGVYIDLLNHIGHLHKKEYDASHVDWWFSHLCRGLAQHYVKVAYENVHKNCDFLSCGPACELWTECLMRYARQNHWMLPSRERFSGFAVARKPKPKSGKRK
ncbi:hypothetical protein FA13DRAFT_60139 [Coprinellus micaceus]|uniref:Nephrocystin 3-like N-terminal domain-containing protein n=1 Tax=Coprinellus micaceus TaxID=71717 RepID=A0A4Y7U1D7_COPMI|nr:hypothetical protein FA13DRAFT_60139 [Coprinellus micaceus]